MINYLPKEKGNEESDLLKIITNENKTLNRLDKQTLVEIGGPFRIQDKNILDQNQMLLLIKQKIAEIILAEKDEFSQYLTLSKFQVLTEKTHNLLKQIFRQIWQQFLERSKDFHKSKRVLPFLCKSQNPHDIQNFHLKIFDSLKMIFGEDNSMYMPGYPPMMPHSLYPMNYPYHFQNQSPDYQNPNKVVAKVEEGANQENFAMEEEKVKKLKPQKPIQKNRPNPISKSFEYCFCRGALQISEKYFTCSHCQKKYHYQCLRISDETKINNDKLAKSKCPFCFLKMNIFFEVFGDPIDFFWSNNLDMHTKKIQLKSQKCSQIVEENLNIQIRFLKIEGSSIFNIKEQSPENFQKVVSPLSEITIRKNLLSQNMNEDVNIKFDNNKGEGEENALILVSAFTVRQLTEAQVKEKVVEVSDEVYLNKFFDYQTTELKIQILNYEGFLIEKPGRGIDCNHVDVFDINEYITRVMENQMQNHCFICQKKCRALVIDVCVEKELQKIRQLHLQHQPQVIYFKKDGTFRWGEVQSRINDEDEDDDDDQQENIDPELNRFDDFGRMDEE